MSITDIYQVVFPVTATSQDNDKGRPIKALDFVAGTAFSIGNDYFITAAHVVDQTANHQREIGCFENEVLVGVPVRAVETFHDIDVAILHAPDVSGAQPFPWSESTPNRLEDVFAAGYPFAFDNRSMNLTARAFGGHIVATQDCQELPGKPSAIELSFQCPRGLSGAPVVTRGREPCIIGLVVGNQSTQMNVFTDKEVITEGNVTIVERYEAMNIGIAIRSQAILALQSRMIGSVREYLTNAGLLR